MKFPSYLVTLFATVLFVILFFEKSLGLNVAIYGVITIVLLVTFKTTFFKPVLNKIVGIGFLMTSVLYYLFASPFTLSISILSFILLIGLHVSVPFRNLFYALLNAMPNHILSIQDFFRSFRLRKKNKRNSGISKLMRVIFLPLFVIFLFVALYSMGSSFFSDAIGQVGVVLSKAIRRVTQYIDIVAVFIALIGLWFAMIHSLGFQSTSLSESDANSSDLLTHIKTNIKSRFRNMDLMIEHKSGVFLFAVLCLLISMLLFLEIKNVWINFQWEGQLLKEMVHEGTYILIVAILVSMVITIYYFRKNLNFYKGNRLIKNLAYLWMGLNSLLVISVFVRNAYYIQHFGLAYKRIGVVFFLLLCLIGLFTLVIKIGKVKSIFYVVRTNSLAAYITLVALCIVNWDGIIAKYNFAHYKTAFVHLPFMSNLSDKTLPYLKLTDDQIVEIETKQVEKIPFVKRGYFKEENYKAKIDERIRKFKLDQKNRHWLESVWAEEKALNLLNQG
ncbi:MAG: hypothetical protein COA58_07025 [Bacteroidetes bacterium]|nr:MAG: hypothetical protein COA58_07025 [Bacteroidota bacterium]